MRASLSLVCLFFLSLSGATVYAESQQGDYPGVTDPFADPSQYEFNEEEKEDKEFFHLGRFLMFGVDGGAGIFTGGLGTSAGAGMMLGARLLYFFDKSLAIEGRFHFSQHLDVIIGQSQNADRDVQMMSFGGGFRFYFDTKSAPRAIAIANPYLAAGAGVYMRNQAMISGTMPLPAFESDSSFGGFAGGGIEFLIYRKHVYLGVDIRYHLVFFSDENDTLSGQVFDGDRAGDYLNTLVTLTYSF